MSKTHHWFMFLRCLDECSHTRQKIIGCAVRVGQSTLYVTNYWGHVQMHRAYRVSTACTKCSFLWKSLEYSFITSTENTFKPICRFVHRNRNYIPMGTRFSARPDRPWGPPSLLYSGYRVFPGDKVRPGRAADHSSPSSAAVMEE